jgi:acetyltransferase-like isoleucine patch superfamily enzyme
MAAEARSSQGVSIGDRAIVGAHAIVTKDVPPDTIVAGNPARVVRELEPCSNASCEWIDVGCK